MLQKLKNIDTVEKKKQSGRKVREKEGATGVQRESGRGKAMCSFTSLPTRNV